MATLVTGVPESAFAEVERDAFGRVGELLGQRGAALTDASLERDQALQELKGHLECVEHGWFPLAGLPPASCGRLSPARAADAHGPVTSASTALDAHVGHPAVRRWLA